MKTATTSALRSNLTEYMSQPEPVVVTRKGRPKAVLVPVENADDLERLVLANNEEFMRILDQADQRISATGGIPHDEFWARLGDET